MVSVRSVTVRLNADVAGYIRDMKAAGAATDAAFAKASRGLSSSNSTLASTSKQLQGVDSSAAGASRSVTSLDRSVTSLDRGMSSVGTRSGQTGDSINQLTGRLRLFADAAAVLGPGLVPIAAVGVPAIAGLTSQLTAAALAAGAVGVAFVGVPDAIGAVAKYDLEPTAANLAAAQAALSKLGPDAQNFVGAFQEFRPVLTDIRDAAAAGVFPGLTESLGNIEDLAPTAARLLQDVGRSAGEAAAAGTESLASGRWRDFFEYLRNDAPQTITTLSATLGDFSHGLSELVETLDPGSDAFEGWIARVADGFDKWSTSDQGRKDVEAFLEYAATNGPKVAEFFGSLTSALAGLVTAAAPLGGAVLTGLTALLDVFGGIANSDIGTPLLTAAAGAALLNRTLGATAGLMGRVTGAQAASGAAAGGLFAGTRAQTAQIGAGFSAMSTKATSARASVTSLARDVKTVGTTWATAGAASERSAARAAAASERLGSAARSAAGTVGKAGAAVGALGVITTEAGQGLGLTNTATLALAGSMMSPLGAAVGAGVGLMLDFASASGDAQKGIDLMDGAVGSAGTNMSLMNSLTSSGNESTVEYLDSVSGVGKAFMALDTAFTGENALDTFASSAEASEQAARDTIAAYQDVAIAAGFETKDAIGRDVLPSLTELTAVAESAAPALAALNIDPLDPKGIREGADEIAGWIANADSAVGRTNTFADSVADLGNDALSTSVSAGAMSTALQNMLVPAMTAESTTDAWTMSLRGLGDALNQGAGFTDKSTGAIENRAASQDYLAVSMERLTGMAGMATTTQGQMARAVADTRSEFIRSATAAGLDRKAVVARANAMGLTPRLVRTVFQAAGIDKSTLQIREARSNLEALPKRVQTQIRAEGIPKTMGEINRLDRKFDLTTKERRALITLRDLASKGIRLVDGKLRGLGRQTARPGVELDTGEFTGKELRARGALAALDRKRAEPDAGLNTTQFTSAQRKALNDVGVLDRQKPTPTANMNDSPFQGRNRNVMNALNVTDRFTATPAANLQDNASGPGRAIQGVLAGIQSKTVTVTVRNNVINSVTNVVNNVVRGIFGAMGMMVQGGVQTYAGGGMRDPSDRPENHLPEFAAAGPTRVWREPETRGESYIPWADDHRRPRAKAIAEQTVGLFGGEVLWYAGGGSRGPGGGNGGGRGGDSDLGGASRDAGKGLRSLTARLKEAEKAVEAERKARDKITSAQQEVTTTGRDLFRTELFGASDSAWGSSDPFAQLQADIAGGNEYQRLVKRLEKMGLDDDALAAGAGSLESARYLAGLGQRRVREFEDLYDRRARVSAQAGRVAGNAAWGEEVREANRELRQANQRLNKIEKAVKQADNNNREGHRDSGRRTARALDRGANKARRRASGPGGRQP